MNPNTTNPLAALNEQPVWMKSTSEIEALHDRKIVVEHGASIRPGYLLVSKADPAGPDAGKRSVAFCQAWLDGEPAWADAGQPIPTSQSRSSHEYLSPEALELIGDNVDGPQVGELRLVIPPE
jgi:hypothetical protein